MFFFPRAEERFVGLVRQKVMPQFLKVHDRANPFRVGPSFWCHPNFLCFFPSNCREDGIF
jgi:hypothetical protein